MAFKAKLVAVELDRLSGVHHATVEFFDEATPAEVAVKTYAFPDGTTRAQALAQIQSDGSALKLAGIKTNRLAADIGSEITIA